MTKRLFLGFGLFILIIIVFINIYLTIEYDINLYEYLFSFNRITAEDQQWLIDNGPFVYASDNNAPPLRFLDAESGEYKGITIDYLRSLSIEIGAQIETVPMQWDYALDQLALGETDMCDMYTSEDRAKKYLFSDPVYFQKGIILVASDNNSIRSHLDLKGVKVAAQKADFTNEFLMKNVPGIEYSFVDDYLEGVNLLISGEVEAVVGDEPVISYFMEQLNLKEDYKIVDEPLYEKSVVLAVHKDDKILQGIINKGIYNLRRKNTMTKIQQKWFGISIPIIQSNTSRVIMLLATFFIAIISVGLFIFLSWNRELQKAVDSRTKELRLSRNDLQTTFDSITNFLILVDKNLRIVNYNITFRNFINKTHNEIHMARIVDIYPPITAYFTGKKSEFFDGVRDFEFRTTDRIYELNTYTLKRYEDDANRLLLMIEDVTDSRLYEQKMLQSNKMSAIGQLAAGVAHEIRNPLGIIRNYVYILKKKFQKEDVEVQSVEIIENQLARASNIIDNLLNFSRISDYKIKDFNLYETIDSIVSLNVKLVEKKHINVKLLIDDIRIRSYEESLNHILINILNNAVDAIDDEGNITIWARENDSFVDVRIIDTGHGIKKEDIDKLYNPFHTTKEPGEGTGLGLYITYNEIEKLRGSIDFKSNYGKGTICHIKIPINLED